jgi:tetratricopeptide (TPR) repeat protein
MGLLNNYRDHYDALSQAERDKLFKYSSDDKFMPSLRPPLTKKLYLTFVATDLIAFKRQDEAIEILERGLETKCQPEDDYPIHDFLARFYDNGLGEYQRTKKYCEIILGYLNTENVNSVYMGDFYPNYIYCRDKFFEIVIEKERQLDRYEDLINLFKTKGLLPNNEKGLIALRNMKMLYHQTSFKVAFEKDLAVAEFHAIELEKLNNFSSSDCYKKLANIYCDKGDFQKATKLLIESIKQYPFVKGVTRLKKKLYVQLGSVLSEEEILKLKMQYIKVRLSNIKTPYDYKFISDLYKDVGLLELSNECLEKYKSPHFPVIS